MRASSPIRSSRSYNDSAKPCRACARSPPMVKLRDAADARIPPGRRCAAGPRRARASRCGTRRGHPFAAVFAPHRRGAREPGSAEFQVSRNGPQVGHHTGRVEQRPSPGENTGQLVILRERLAKEVGRHVVVPVDQDAESGRSYQRTTFPLADYAGTVGFTCQVAAQFGEAYGVHVVTDA